MDIILRRCSVCGLEAKSENDLDLFVSRPHKPYGRDTICKKCSNKKRAKPKLILSYLRKCRVCGFEAHNEEELKLFIKSNDSKYGRDNVCKKCFNKKGRKPRRTNLIRKTKLLKTFSIPLLCYFCGLEVTVLNGKAPESLCFHSLDFNHDNWSPENKVPAHKKCHNSYHSMHSSLETRLKISLANSGDKCYNWKGDNAKPQAKKIRNRNEERRKRKAKLLEAIEFNENNFL